MRWGHLQSFSPVDGPEGPQYTQYSENLHHGDGAGAEEERGQSSGHAFGLTLRPGRRGWVGNVHHSLDTEGDEGHTDHQ